MDEDGEENSLVLNIGLDACVVLFKVPAFKLILFSLFNDGFNESGEFLAELLL